MTARLLRRAGFACALVLGFAVLPVTAASAETGYTLQFENYDGVGRYRTTEITDATLAVTLGDGFHFVGYGGIPPGVQITVTYSNVDTGAVVHTDQVTAESGLTDLASFMAPGDRLAIQASACPTAVEYAVMLA